MSYRLQSLLSAACVMLCGLALSHPAVAQDLPEGKGKAEFVHNCTACHLASMVIAVRKTPEDWRKSVDEMASRGTDGTKEDLDNVYLYLVKNYSAPAQTQQPAPATPGPTAPAPASAPTAPAPGPLTAADVERAKSVVEANNCLLCHRIGDDGGEIAPSLNGIGTRRKPEEIRAAIVTPPPMTAQGTVNTMPTFFAKRIKEEDLNILIRYLVSLPAAH